MTTITISLPEDHARKLQALAEDAGVEPGELLRARVEEWLQSAESDFETAASYVLNKNAELYRRLA
jgi:antitoxin FitA